jgi:hypothetical protein
LTEKVQSKLGKKRARRVVDSSSYEYEESKESIFTPAELEFGLYFMKKETELCIAHINELWESSCFIDYRSHIKGYSSIDDLDVRLKGAVGIANIYLKTSDGR